MSRSKYDIANTAIRIFLQDVGKFYDEARHLKPFVPLVGQLDELLSYFSGQCCYCGYVLTRKTVSLDHLIPMNKVALGLHAWGNVVPCCQPCNKEKQQTPWKLFLGKKAIGTVGELRQELIEGFVLSKLYDPNLDLHEYADNLYEDVGAVAMTLIQLRYKQAEAGIKSLLKTAPLPELPGVEENA